jgi:hypothetical protein
MSVAAPCARRVVDEECSMKRLSGLTLALLAALTASVAIQNVARAEQAASETPSNELTAAQRESFAKRLFAGKITNKKSYACFVRRYDAAHLAAHPKQKVNSMKLLVTAETDPEAEALQHSFRLGVSFRHRRGNFDSSGSCGGPMTSEVSVDKLQIGCGVDFDGGGVSIEMAKTDKSVLVRLERVRIWQNNKPDEEDGLALEAGADDHVFRLDRADLEDCRALIADRQELAAMRRK